MPICCITKQECHVTLNIKSLFGTTTGIKQQRVYHQMYHASSERLKRLLKNAGCNDSEVIKLDDEYVENCEFCRKYGKPILKPGVCFPVAERSEVVCMDLKKIQKERLWFLHTIDGATKHTVAVIIDTKMSEIVVD